MSHHSRVHTYEGAKGGSDVARLRIIIKLKKKVNKINRMKFSSFQY